MTYIAVIWKHDLIAEPSLLYSELDEQRWERRKMEVFRDGRLGFADINESSGGTRLGLEPIPDLSEIARDPQFQPATLSKDEFEQLWSKRKDARLAQRLIAEILGNGE